MSWVLSSKTVVQESGVGCVSAAEEDISHPVLN